MADAKGSKAPPSDRTHPRILTSDGCCTCVPSEGHSVYFFPRLSGEPVPSSCSASRSCLHFSALPYITPASCFSDSPRSVRIVRNNLPSSYPHLQSSSCCVQVSRTRQGVTLGSPFCPPHLCFEVIPHWMPACPGHGNLMCLTLLHWGSPSSLRTPGPCDRPSAFLLGALCPLSVLFTATPPPHSSY